MADTEILKKKKKRGGIDCPKRTTTPVTMKGLDLSLWDQHSKKKSLLHEMNSYASCHGNGMTVIVIKFEYFRIVCKNQFTLLYLHLCIYFIKWETQFSIDWNQTMLKIYEIRKQTVVVCWSDRHTDRQAGNVKNLYIQKP